MSEKYLKVILISAVGRLRVIACGLFYMANKLQHIGVTTY